MFAVITDISRLIFWGPVRKAVSQLSPDSLSMLERILSLFAYSLLRERRNIITKELKKSFANEWTNGEISNVVRNSIKNFIGSQLWMFHLPRMNSTNIDEYIAVKGIEYIEEAIKKNKGVIILNPHFGPFMLIMPSLGYRGYKVNQIALQGTPMWLKREGIEKKVYDIKFRSIEQNMPVNFINASAGAHSIRKVFTALKNNEIILYPSTGRGGTSWHTVEFMRRNAPFSLFPFKMALKSGATLLPAFVFNEGRRARVVFEKPIDFDKNSTSEYLLEKYVEVLDSYVKKYPEHFVMYLYEIDKMTHYGLSPFFNE